MDMLSVEVQYVTFEFVFSDPCFNACLIVIIILHFKYKKYVDSLFDLLFFSLGWTLYKTWLPKGLY